MRTSPDVLDTIFKAIDQAQQLSDLADLTSALELGSEVSDLCKQFVDLFLTAFAPLVLSS